MARPLNEIYEEQARLYELHAAAMSDEILAVGRRAEATRRLASEKRDERLQLEKEHEKVRLDHEIKLLEREAEIMDRERAAVEAERERALAQAVTARQKARLDRPAVLSP
jgi:hypothetical protein